MWASHVEMFRHYCPSVLKVELVLTVDVAWSLSCPCLVVGTSWRQLRRGATTGNSPAMMQLLQEARQGLRRQAKNAGPRLLWVLNRKQATRKHGTTQ